MKIFNLSISISYIFNFYLIKFSKSTQVNYLLCQKWIPQISDTYACQSTKFDENLLRYGIRLIYWLKTSVYLTFFGQFPLKSIMFRLDGSAQCSPWMADEMDRHIFANNTSSSISLELTNCNHRIWTATSTYICLHLSGPNPHTLTLTYSNYTWRAQYSRKMRESVWDMGGNCGWKWYGKWPSQPQTARFGHWP